jgi:hypothetical protein
MEPELMEILKRMELKIDKNTMILENLSNKVEIIAEVQTAHKEQSERNSNKVFEVIGNKTELIGGTSI